MSSHCSKVARLQTRRCGLKKYDHCHNRSTNTEQLNSLDTGSKPNCQTNCRTGTTELNWAQKQGGSRAKAKPVAWCNVSAKMEARLVLVGRNLFYVLLHNPRFCKRTNNSRYCASVPYPRKTSFLFIVKTRLQYFTVRSY